MKIFRVLLLVLTGAVAAVGCRSGQTRLIMPEKLFELPIGKTETDLAFFTDGHTPSPQDIRVKMRDGLIYVMDPGVNKLMEFNSYGEILTLWFDPELNPPPTLLKENAEPGKEVTKKAFAFSFHRITDFAVNSQKRVYIADRRPFENAVVSTEYGLPLVCTVICFGKTGEAEYTLGQFRSSPVSPSTAATASTLPAARKTEAFFLNMTTAARCCTKPIFPTEAFPPFRKKPSPVKAKFSPHRPLPAFSSAPMFTPNIPIKPIQPILIFSKPSSGSAILKKTDLKDISTCRIPKPKPSVPLFPKRRSTPSCFPPTDSISAEIFFSLLLKNRELSAF